MELVGTSGSAITFFLMWHEQHIQVRIITCRLNRNNFLQSLKVEEIPPIHKKGQHHYSGSQTASITLHSVNSRRTGRKRKGERPE